MLRTVFLLLCVVLSAAAEKKVELFATNLDTNSSFVKASKDVVVLYEDMYISAETASYSKESGILELYGNISVLKGAQYFAMGDYLMLNTQEQTRQFRPFFFQDHADELWMSAQSAKTKKEEYELTKGIASSCNPQNPDWTLRFSSGYYDEEEQWMQLYNARLYAGEVPVFYLPYIAYPTDTTRRTGLLRPNFGLSGDEGFMYKQPLYIAEDPQWDLEIVPQSRAKRGKGLYTTLRFVDSQKSSGSLVVGGFREKESYQKEFNLRNEEHYGIDFDYQHRDVLNTWFDWSPQGSSALYADITYLNDVEYLNLKQNDSLNYATQAQVASRVNLYLNQSENFFGSYFRYYIDLNKKSNSDTIQNLPILHYHHALNTFLDDHLLYSVDYRGTNFYRETRKNAMQNEVTIPLDLQFSLFDEYLTLTLSENIYASHLNFYGSDNPDNPNPRGTDTGEGTPPAFGYSPGAYARDSQRVELNTNLVKSFEEMSHSVDITLAYLHPGQEKRSGFYADYEEEFKNDCIAGSTGVCEYNTINELVEQASVEFTQYLFTENMDERLYHRLKQPLILQDGYDKYGELENELRFYFTKAFNYYNSTFYNHERSLVSKTQNSLGYNDTVFIFNVSHLYEDKVLRTVRTRASYITSDARYNYSAKWQYYAGYAYDVERSETKNRHLGFAYNKRCWGAELKYLENIRPTMNAGGQSSSIQDKVLYLTLNLRPLGGMEVHYKKSEIE